MSALLNMEAEVFANMVILKIAVLTALVACAAGLRASGDTVTLTGFVGAHRLSFAAQSVAKESKLTVKSPGDYLAITEVYPDAADKITYKYRLSGSGIGCFERTHTSRGFGPVTYFIRVRTPLTGPIKITNHQTGQKPQPVLISSVWGVKSSDLKSILEWDRFTIMGLVTARPEPRNVADVEALAKNLPSRPEDHIGIGFSSEIHFCNTPRENVKAQLQTCSEWASKYKMPAMLGLVSWWSGTPGREPDGLGGTFGDMKYQQVCYSPDVDVPENPELKSMLGDRYNTHYGLSVPNQWSSCPWLTMNSTALNEYRHKRLAEAVSVLKEISGGRSNWVKGLYIDNEPRYWDTLCEAGNPHSKRGELWADFNPLTVADAKKDGVELDPADGLSNEELSWLHKNVGRYNQGMVDALKTALAKHKFGPTLPVYTHSLQHQDMFPGGPINHAASEWGFAKGARTGLEGMWGQPKDFARVREWGPWSNLNREEADGQPVDLHLWDLRVAYMTGADLYNSYNWQALGEGGFFAYAKEFAAEFPVATLPPAEARLVDSVSLKIKTPMKLQAFTSVQIPVHVEKSIKGCAFLGVAFEDGTCFCSQQQPVDLAAGTRTLTIDFTTPAEVPHDKEALVVLYVFDAKGTISLRSVSFTAASAKGMTLSLDLRTQRALSLAVINKAKRMNGKG